MAGNERRPDRVAAAIQEEVARALSRDAKDPRITAAFVTVTGCEVSRDLRTAKVFVSILGRIPQKRASKAEACSKRDYGAKAGWCGKAGAGQNGSRPSSVSAGIAFLGVGAIIRHDNKETPGLTTAANVFVVAAIGIACGMGAWQAALFGSTLALIVLVGLSPIEQRLERMAEKKRGAPGAPQSDDA